MNGRSIVAATLAGVAGAVLWFAAAFASGRREPWDAPFYWMIAFPASLAVCAGLGYRHPDRPWRWALLLFQGQFVAMCIGNGEVGSLAPLGMLLFALLSLPGMLAARIGARLGGWRDL
jgi:hypothetical protein